MVRSRAWFTSQEIGDLLCLSERTVRRYITLFRQTGDVKPASRRNGSQRLLGDLSNFAFFSSYYVTLAFIYMNFNTNYKKLLVSEFMSPQYVIPSSSWGVQGR